MSYIVKVYSHKEDPAPYWNGNLFRNRWSMHQRDARRFDSLEQAKQRWSEVQPAISPSAKVRFVWLKPRSPSAPAAEPSATDSKVLELTIEVARLRALVARAVVYIDTAADTIESMQGDDLDGECEEARDFVKELRKVLE